MTRGMWAAGAAAVLGLVLGATPATAATIFWTDWQESSSTGGFTGFGEIVTSTSTVDVTYHNDLGISFLNDGVGSETDYWAQGSFGSLGRHAATSRYTGAVVDNIPTGTDMIALNQAGSQTLTFSEAIVNPVFGFVSLNGNGYSFLNQDFEILSQTGGGNDSGYWGNGTVTRVAVPLAGTDIEYQLNGIGEPHGVIRFLGTFDTLTWRSTNAENWNGFTVGVLGTAVELTTTTDTTTTNSNNTSGSAPEPASLVLLGMGLLTASARLRRRP